MADVVASVVAVLQAAGYRAGNANPGGIIPEITEPVLAVNLERANMEKKTLVIRVTVVTPISKGAKSCETQALAVCRLLGEIGCNCEMQPCKFDAKTEVFSSAVLASFQGNIMDQNWMIGDMLQVRFGSGYYLDKVTSFAAWQVLNEEQALGECVWNIQVEETLDAIRTENVPSGTTKITVYYEGGQEAYNECTLCGRKRIIRDGKIVQIWEATAKSRTIST
ncbi:MAG: hypothetical protein E7448_08900 [Ruminococcaceae bacterium]|nr:hypothetical protein [Oscillospiraceae bacterium]